MANVTFMEGVQLMMGLGIFSGGIGMCKWALRMERRVMRLEVKGNVVTSDE